MKCWAPIESGVDFEKRISSIYPAVPANGRDQNAFDQLQLELSLEINEAMSQIRQKLLENFDDEVREEAQAFATKMRKVNLDRFLNNCAHARHTA